MTPYTFEERLLHVAEAQQVLPTQIPWLTDGMDDQLHKNLGGRPNSEWVIGPDLEILVKRAWSDPAVLRQDLIGLVGTPPTTTTVADLNLPPRPRPQPEPKSRVKAPRKSKPLVLEPLGKPPHYVKLRAEADRSLLNKGKGKLYLEFRVDPIHKVHWNNLAGPVRLQTSSESQIRVVNPDQAGILPTAESDDAPRTFLLDVTWPDAEAVLDITLDCWVCSDREGWCRAIRYGYRVSRQQDALGGWRLRGFLKRMINWGDRHYNR